MNCHPAKKTPSAACCLRLDWGRRVLGLAVLFATLSYQEVTAAPANDTCGNATAIPGAGPFPYLSPMVDISSATTSGDPPIPEDFYKTRVIRSVWYTFRPASNAVYTLSTCAGADATGTTADTVMALYTSAAGCNGPFVAEGNLDDETCSPQATLTRQLLADTQYYLVIWKYCDACVEDGMNDVQVQVTATIPPANDICAGAIPVQLNLPVVGTTSGAFDNYQLANTNGFAGINQTPSTAPGRDVVYSFTALKTGEYSFRVNGYNVRQDLVLYVAPVCPSGNGSLANVLGAANRSQVNSSEEVLCLPLTAGQQVFVFVDDSTGGNAGSDFTLEVVPCVREREPNDTTIDAAPLACGVEGSISRPGDLDFFALGSYPAGWRAFAMVDGEAGGNADLDLRLTTRSDTVEYDDHDNDVSFGSASPNLAGTPLTGGPSFLFVNHHFAQEAEPYRLYAVVQPPSGLASPESEPNNSPSEANSSEQNYFRGALDGPADTDVYAFSVAEGDLIFLGLDCDPHRTNAPINAQLELLDSSGTLLVSVDDGDFSSSGGTNVTTGTIMGFTPSSPGEALVYRVPGNVEGAFYARVSMSPNAGGAVAGEYLLSISKNCFIGSDGLNHAPTLTNVVLASPAFSGIPATLKGTLWELDTGDALTLTIRWGDGMTNIVRYDTPGRIEFAIPHTFNATNATFTVSLDVRDNRGAANAATLEVPVSAPQPARFEAISVLPNGNILLQLRGAPLASYRVEQGEGSGKWTSLGQRTADGAGLFGLQDSAPTAATRFYRAVLE
jgi:hypothetical protein